MTEQSSLYQLSKIVSKRQRVHFGGLLFLMLVGSSLEIIGFGLLIPFLGAISSPETILESEWVTLLVRMTGPISSDRLILLTSVFLAIAFLLKNLFLVVQWRIIYTYVYRRLLDLQSRLFRSYLHAPYLVHISRNTARAIRNITGETNNVYAGVILPGMALFTETIVACGLLVILLAVNPVPATIAIFIIAFVGFAATTTVKTRLTRWSTRRIQAHGDMIRCVSESLHAFKDVRILQREQFFVRTFDRFGKEYLSSVRQFLLFSLYPSYFLEVVAAVGLVTLVILAILLPQPSGSPSLLPQVTIFGAVVVRFVPSVSRIVSSINTMRFHAPSIAIVAADLGPSEAHVEGSVENGDAPGPRLPFKGTITAKKLVFSYPNSNAPALDNISLAISHGSAFGIVGRSGAGKTTLVNILLGLIPPTAGQVLVDGIDVRGHEPAWMAAIGYVPQDAALIDDSIRKNIALGLPPENTVEDAIWQALDAAELSGFVRSLPKGLDTTVGEHGIQISGGQRQRIAIARALYSQPDVLFLDEATASLDHHTEQTILDSIARLAKRTTVIMITHRLHSVRWCPMIAVLEEGRLVAQGPYEDLSDSSDAFRRLVSSQ